MTLHLAVTAVLVLAADAKLPAPPRADEPTAATFSPQKAAGFLDNTSLAWTRSRKCGACHTNYPYLLARPALPAADAAPQREVRSFFEERVQHWDRGQKGDAPRWPAEVVATAATFALIDARAGELRPVTRTALDRIWTLQQSDGSWKWLKCNWPPMEHDDDYGVVYAAVGVGHAPGGYAAGDSAKAGVAKLVGYLRANRPADMHHTTMLLWAATKLDGLMTPAEKEKAVKDLLALQRPDGGWCLPGLAPAWKRHDGTANDPAAPSDGYATGLVVYVLRQAGLPADHAALKRGAGWLAAHQRESGRWFTRSVSADNAHYITNAGTAYAVLALESCGALGSKTDAAAGR
jgi:squalene-hopene/tetraprenyl-beta-curcumene cyclase